jgi:two-component system cell cycle response regulator DivK
MAKILVVEDLADNRELVRDLLQLARYEVIEASNGQMALELAEREQPDLILMDISLPNMDGFATTTKLKASPTLAAIPVVFVSAHAMEKEQRRASEVGGDGYITKPIDIHEFMSQVQSYLTRTAPVEQLQ